MEIRTEQGGSHAIKVIESLKKHLFDTTDSGSSKTVSSHEVCTSMIDLVETVCTSAPRPNLLQVISQSVELLVHACSSSDHHIRLSASENLKKMIKNLMNVHLSRLQQDLFHELKKNGTPRSLCVALDCFSSLFPLTRPAKCSSYAQALLPILVRLTSRQEEALHEALQDAMSKILPTMTPFVTTSNLQSFMAGLVDRFASSSSSYRRMASSCLVITVANSRMPSTTAEWLVSKLLEIGCQSFAKNYTIQGVLLTFQQLYSQSLQSILSLSTLKLVFCFTISVLLYCDGNTIVSALESLHQLLLSVDAEFEGWLLSTNLPMQVATKFWNSTSEPSLHSGGNDTQSLGEDLEVAYFDLDESTDNLDDSKTEPERNEQLSLAAFTTLPVLEQACFALADGPKSPLENLVEYISSSVLNDSRVSVKSLGLSCITAALDIYPYTCITLKFVESYLSAKDPKLRSQAVMLLATIISSNLRQHGGDFSETSDVLSSACDQLYSMLDDDTQVVQKAVCEALQMCLPLLVSTSEHSRVEEFVYKLLPLRESSYWRTKVQLLETLGGLDFTSIAVYCPRIPEAVLTDVVFNLLGDSDHRVRAVACQCLVRMAPNVQVCGDPILAHAKWQSAQLFSHLQSINIELSLAGIGDSTKVHPNAPLGLKHILWFLLGNIGSTVDHKLQRGCLEAFHLLSHHYPPPSMPTVWGCLEKPYSILSILLQLLTSSRIVWGIQAHCEVLQTVNSLYLASTLSQLQQMSQAGQPWGALKEPLLREYATVLLTHIVKVLCVYVHIIEERDPEAKEKRLPMPVISPRKGPGDLPSPGRQKPQILEALQKSSLVPKDGLGQFAHLPHYMKIYDASKAAYGNYKVTLVAVGEDKFSKLLQICHDTLAALLEAALADDVGKHVEEILGYIHYTVKVDPSGGLLCVQQLLNALFGLNVASQHTYIYSPYISSLPYDIRTSHQLVWSSHIYGVTVSDPVKMILSLLESSSPIFLQSPNSSDQSEPKKRQGRLSLKKAFTMKPANSVSSIKDFIGYFEPLVVLALNQFSYTSSILLQQRVLFLLVQLLHLKVRYELLDCNHTFLESVNKLVNLMETGMVKGAETLVPHLFQFLVMLAYDSSKLVTIPQVMQKCDGVMASGHNVTTFAIPALQPLVLTLFVRPSRESNTELDTQREVVLNMLLRLIEHPRIIVLLCYVLDCYRKNRDRWQQVSNQIYAGLLSSIGKLHILLDDQESLIALYQLLSAMDPVTVNIQAFFTALMKTRTLTSVVSLVRWMGVVCTMMELMITLFPESTFLEGIGSIQLSIPEVESTVVNSEGFKVPSDVNKVTQLAYFLRETLHFGASALHQLVMQRDAKKYSLLSKLVANMLLILQSLVQGTYHSLRAALSSLGPNSTATTTFHHLLTKYPLLALHYASLNFYLSGDITVCDVICQRNHTSVSSVILQHSLLMLVCKVSTSKAASSELCMAIAKSPILLHHCQEPAVINFLRIALNVSEVKSCLWEHLQMVDVNKNPTQGLKVVSLSRVVPSFETLTCLCKIMVSSCISSLTAVAETTAIAMLSEGVVSLTSEEARKLVTMMGQKSSKFIEVVVRLYEPEKSLSVDGGPSQDTSVPVEFDNICYSKIVREFCRTAGPDGSAVCARVLGRLEQASITEVIESHDFPLVFLRDCIAHGVLLSLNKDNSKHFAPDSMQSNPQHSLMHPLLQTSVDRLFKAIRDDCTDSKLTATLIRLLTARHHLPAEIAIDNATASAILELINCSMTENFDDPLEFRTAVDCCTMALQSADMTEAVSEEWLCKVVLLLFDYVANAFPVSKLEGKRNAIVGLLESGCTEPTAVDLTKSRLFWILQVLLDRSAESTPWTLHLSLESLTFTLCRLPQVHAFIMTPPALIGEGTVSEKVLDQALMESEILQQFMQRCNPLGWLNRTHFEERWMQLLGVINQPYPPEGINPEEYQAHTVNVCAGLRAVTSLLLGTMLRPVLGNPTSSVPIHTHRNNEMLFLGSRPGRKLANIRKGLEMQLLLQCGERSSLYDYYQSPVLSHVSSPYYPPLYTRNVERDLGNTMLNSSQMSLNSLWPIMLMQTPLQVDVDLSSCIISLTDLYTHWLTQPIHSLLLHHVLTSIVMLSDLFALSGQFDWMLRTLLEIYENHPPEDVAVTALALFGLLKASAILKCDGVDAERISKIVEKSLSSEGLLPVQTSCIHGLLYVTEDPNSAIVAMTAAIITKYILNCLQNISRYSESHVKLVWSLAVSMIMFHSHQVNLVKDANFCGHLLELVIPILVSQQTSTNLFHSLTTGLELLVVNFSLSVQERTKVATTAASRFLRSDQTKSLAALSLLVACMYTDNPLPGKDQGVDGRTDRQKLPSEEADVVSGLPQAKTNPLETALLAREQVNNLMERLRHGPLVDIEFLVDVLPQLIVDFLPPMEVLQTVVNEFISPHQSRPELAAVVMAEAFNLLLAQDKQEAVTDWVLLCLENFVHQEPEARALWSTACLLMAASVDNILRHIFQLICFWKGLPSSTMLSILTRTALTFHNEQCEQQQQLEFVEKFSKSKYSSLRQVAQSCVGQ